MAGITRLGLGGFSRPRYGDFSGRTPVEPPVVTQTLGNLGWDQRKQKKPPEREFRKDTLRAEIEELFRETRDIKVSKAVEQQIVKIVAPGSDRIPSGIPIGDLLQSIEQMERLLEILRDLRQKKDDDLLILMMLA